MKDVNSKYDEEILEYRKIFLKTVDINDPDSIQKWFAKYPFLSVNDHARIADRSPFWVRRLRAKANIRGNRPKNIPRSIRKKKAYTIEVPDDWDNPQWLQEALNKHSVLAISKVTGTPRTTLYSKIKKYGLRTPGQLKATAPKNPCFNYEWCYENYVNQNLSQKECALRAGISTTTFNNWLVRLKIPVKPPIGPQSLWVRKLIFNLNKIDVVTSVKIYPEKILVKFRDYHWENYYFKPMDRNRLRSYNITEKDAEINNIPKISEQYESGIHLINEHPSHIRISNKEWKKATFIEKRLALHEFYRTVKNRGYLRPTHPEHVIKEELHKLKDLDYSKFFKNKTVSLSSKVGSNPNLGFKIACTFFDYKVLWDTTIRNNRQSFPFVNKLVKDNVEISYSNLLRAVIRRNTEPKLYDPRAYSYILKYLNCSDAVLDLYPGYGYKAIACSLLGIKYYTFPNEHFDAAIDRGFAKFLNLNHSHYQDEKVDLLIADRDFVQTDLSIALRYAKNAKNMLYHVERNNRKYYEKILPPQNILKVRMRARNLQTNYMFIY